MQAIESLEKLKYIFNSLKISEDAAKTAMKNFLKNKAGQLAMDLSPVKFNQLFGQANAAGLITHLNTNPNSYLLNFVEAFE